MFESAVSLCLPDFTSRFGPQYGYIIIHIKVVAIRFGPIALCYADASTKDEAVLSVDWVIMVA